MSVRSSHIAPIWLSRDPLGEYAGINIYGYVLNNPVNEGDPFGLCGESNFGFGPTPYQAYMNGNPSSVTAAYAEWARTDGRRQVGELIGVTALAATPELFVVAATPVGRAVLFGLYRLLIPFIEISEDGFKFDPTPPAGETVEPKPSMEPDPKPVPGASPPATSIPIGSSGNGSSCRKS